MNSAELAKKYCTGCGLCRSELGINMVSDAKGYLRPETIEKQNIKFLDQVCPVLDDYKSVTSDYNIWGPYIDAVGAYSSDDDTRKKASSGGVLTEIAAYLLDKRIVDGIIHIKADENVPYKTVCVISSNREEVINCCGSRYAISSPWLELSTIINPAKKYAAIGKPCDIRALRRLKNSQNKYKNIIYLFSFFCAGLPSEYAQYNLINSIGSKKEECASITYRGNGWPGLTTVTDKSGTSHTMQYSKAWGGILGREVNPFCRICMDGIGEAADIACGDGWYIKDNQPDFSEHEGRNIVFLRTEKGDELFKKIFADGKILTEPWNDINTLKIIQKYQYTRKTTMHAKILANKICLQPVPRYNAKTLRGYAKKSDFKTRFKIFGGTLKRIIKHKM